MKLGDWLSYWLICNYFAVGVAYGIQGDYWRILYWFGAVCIVLATVNMK